MRKFHLTLVMVFVSLCAPLNAQTLKNIHRHNLPVLQIPVDLIDKVETVDLNGVKTLRITPLFGEITQIPVSEVDSITHYQGDVSPEQLGGMRTSTVIGVVRDNQNEPLKFVPVRGIFGGEETITDINGVFKLNEILVYDKLGCISVESHGYHKSARSFLPSESGVNQVNIQLIPLWLIGSFNATVGGEFTTDLLQINFPPDGIQRNGQPYNGIVRVYAKSLDPTSLAMFDQMPGELVGGMNDSLMMLRSFGMATVELRDSSFKLLQMRDGSLATLSFTIPNDLLGDAPESIDWWSFDDNLGYWKHEGLAQKQGNQYIGFANHFSWWNCDVPANFNDFHGTINDVGGSPISDAQISVFSPTLGIGIAYANSEGNFSVRVPKNELLTLNIYLTCNTTNDWTLAYSEEFESAIDPISGQYIATLLDERFPITGTVLNCSGQPVENGYVKMGNRVFLTDGGSFTILTCSTGEYIVQAFDLSDNSFIRASEADTILVNASGFELGFMETCTTVYENVQDFEGNNYPAVLIGDQMWFAENLKTAHFSDGTVIPNIIDNADWLQTNTPAWCNLFNDMDYGALYGKLYKGITVTSTNNVCPIGWHVPSVSEWLELINYSGGPDWGAGNLKASSGWSNLGAQGNLAFGGPNEYSFSALPGLARNGDGTMPSVNSLGSFSYWWSTTEENGDLNTIVFAYFGSGHEIYIFPLNIGLSVRCVKD